MIHPIHCIGVYRCIRYAVSYTPIHSVSIFLRGTMWCKMYTSVSRYISLDTSDISCITLADVSVYLSGSRMYRVPPWRSLASVRSSCRRLKLAQPCAPARGGQEAGCLEPRASCSSSTRRRSPARPSVAESHSFLVRGSLREGYFFSG